MKKSGQFLSWPKLGFSKKADTFCGDNFSESTVIVISIRVNFNLCVIEPLLIKRVLCGDYYDRA